MVLYTHLSYVLLFIGRFLAVEAVHRGSATANTSFGLLVGNHYPLHGCNSWLGVPYAEAPVGKLRFVGPKLWTRAYPSKGYNARNYGAFCPQISGGDEDCLFLNVWSPTGTAANLPVMVWIHGGAFVLGATSSEAPGVIPNAYNTYDGCGLSARYSVVVASMNYRLGPLGFLSFPTDDHPSRGTMDANFGMRDQRAALQWLQHELPAFGGDPAKVTIFGESAGGISVFYHLASPRSRGLFRAAISESGFPNAFTSAYARNLTLTFGASLNCSDLATLRSCLMGKDTKTLIAAANEAANPFTSAGWSPTVDGLDMPDVPLKIFRHGQTNQVPVLAGTNTDEGNAFVWPWYEHGMNNSQYHEAMHEFLNGQHDPAQRFNDTEMASVFAEYAATCTSDDKRTCASPAITDATFLCGTHFAAQWHSVTSPFYLYRFNHRSLCNALTNKGIPGVYHASELIYVFGDPLTEACLLSPAESSLARRMQTMWTNFARDLEPTLTSHAKENFPEYTNDSRSSVVLQTPADIIETDYRGKYCNFWTKVLYSKWVGPIRDFVDISSAVIV